MEDQENAVKDQKEKKVEKKDKVEKAEKKEKKTPTSGQSAPPIEDLEYAKLNSKEQKVLECVAGDNKGERKQKSLADVAEECFVATQKRGKAQANSWVRNSLRRLVRGGWLEKVERGTYRITEKGRKRMLRLEESKKESKVDGSEKGSEEKASEKAA